MDVRELISLEDERKILDYINYYGPSDDCCETVGQNRNIDDILRCWLDNKSNFLLTLFGNKLIHKFDINYILTETEFSNKLMSDDSLEYYLRLIKDGWYHFCSNCCNENAKDFPFIIESEYFDDLFSLIQWDNFIKGKYLGPTLILRYRDSDKKIVIEHDCKIIKILMKLNKIFSFSPYLDDFTNRYTQLLGERYRTGELCLSIHPLDYLTMSDNDCGWTSCMSWFERGSYRGGTVEMLNSPTVIVAYLSSKKDFRIFNNSFWNSKKWRSLFIVTPQVITNIKGYPYQARELDNLVLDHLKELAEKNCGIHYSENTTWSYGKPFLIDIADKPNVQKTIRFNFATDLMYNDFGSLKNNICCTNFNLQRYERLSTRDGVAIFHLYYSGLMECMNCGALDIYCADSDHVFCEECETSYKKCEYCGESLCPSDGYNLINYYGEDFYVCPYCFENECYIEYFSGEYALKDDLYEINIVDEDLNKIVAEYNENSSEYYHFKYETVQNLKCDETIWISRNTDISGFETILNLETKEYDNLIIREEFLDKIYYISYNPEYHKYHLVSLRHYTPALNRWTDIVYFPSSVYISRKDINI